MASLRKSPFSLTLSHTKNEKPAIRRKIDGLLSSQDTRGLKIESGEHHKVHYVLRRCPFLDLEVSIFYKRIGARKVIPYIISHSFYISNPFGG